MKISRSKDATLKSIGVNCTVLDFEEWTKFRTSDLSGGASRFSHESEVVMDGQRVSKLEGHVHIE